MPPIATSSVFLMTSFLFLSFSEATSIHRSILMSVLSSSPSSLLVIGRAHSLSYTHTHTHTHTHPYTHTHPGIYILAHVLTLKVRVCVSLCTLRPTIQYHLRPRPHPFNLLQ